MMIVCLVPFLCGLIGLHLISDGNPYARLACLWITFTYTASWTLSMSLATANTAGHTKKTTTNAIIIIGYCLGNFCGPFFFKTGQAPTYSLGIGMMFFCLALQVLVITGLFVVLYVRNSKKERLLQENVIGDNAHHQVEDASLDITDLENINFKVRIHL